MVAPIGTRRRRALWQGRGYPAVRSHAAGEHLARAPHARLYFIEDHHAPNSSHSLRTAVR